LVKSTGTALGVSAVGVAFDILYAAGSSVNGISADLLNLASSTSGQLLVLSPSQFIGNEVAVASEDFIVKIKSGQSIL